ncbi:TetR/AcrR family transcriptional regulator [Streptomyces sp. 4N509B]|uniref:TetR/AcrR family transcriptional regulator n=1 Tax=Streptomyces sp. 4N509B TaxID=3457413 RepID=UPI003FD3AA87
MSEERSRGELREEAILLAAVVLLTEVGYDQMTIEDVARRAKASKATIYRRWTGKADLVATAVRRYADTPVTAPAETASLRDDLMAVLLDLRASLNGQGNALILGLLSAIRRDPLLAETVRRHVIEHKRQIFATVLARAAARGEVPVGTDHALVAEVSSAVLFSRLLVTGEPLDDAFLGQLVDAVLLPMVHHQLQRA